MVKIKKFVFNPFQENTFVLYDDTKECVVIDAGCYEDSEYKQLDDFILENGLKVKYILNTHCHIDHILGNAYLADKYKVSSVAHEGDLPIIERANDMALAYGFRLQQPPIPDYLVKDGDEIKFGNTTLIVNHVPGHSPGSITFYSIEGNFVIVGDVLFYGSIGRTDLPGGDYNTLISGIKEKLFALKGDVVVYPGHGEQTSIEFEKNNNPFFR